MNFKENKFLILLGSITLLLAILLIYLGWGARGRAKESSQEVENTKSQIQRLTNGKLFPNAKNEREKRANLERIKEELEKLKGSVAKYRPAPLANISPAAFSAETVETQKRLLAYFKSKEVASPEGWRVGFEQYQSSAARDSATGLLQFQLHAFDWLFRKVADSGVSEVVNFYRPMLPIENGGEWGALEVSVKGQKKGYVVRRLPFELTVRGREKALRTLLNELANSEEYFVTFTAVAVQNEKITPPGTDQVEFAKKGGSPSTGGGETPAFGNTEFFFTESDGEVVEEAALEEAGEVAGEEGAEEAAEPAVVLEEPRNPNRILDLVAGDEQVNLYLAGNVMLLSPENGDGETTR